MGTSEFMYGRVKVEALEPIPNADEIVLARLSMRGDSFNYPVVVRKGAYAEGDSAFYVPVGAEVAPEPEFEFLGGGNWREIKAKRLRGVYSMGLLVPMTDIAAIGKRYGGNLNMVIRKRVVLRPGNPFKTGAYGHFGPVPPFHSPIYGLENLRHGAPPLNMTDQVIVTEKIHGSNFRLAVDMEGQLYMGSHRVWRDTEKDSSFFGEWLRRQKDIAQRIATAFGPWVTVYGEIFGPGVQDLTYGASSHTAVRMFDAYDGEKHRWLTDEEFYAAAQKAGFATVPMIYGGTYGGVMSRLFEMAEGKSTLANHVREGVVLKSADGKFRGKVVGFGYKTRKNAQDFTDE